MKAYPVHTGVKRREEMKDTSTAFKSLFEALAKYFGKVEKVMNDDGQHNQRETGTKLL